MPSRTNDMSPDTTAHGMNVKTLNTAIVRPAFLQAARWQTHHSKFTITAHYSRQCHDRPMATEAAPTATTWQGSPHRRPATHGLHPERHKNNGRTQSCIRVRPPLSHCGPTVHKRQAKGREGRKAKRRHPFPAGIIHHAERRAMPTHIRTGTCAPANRPRYLPSSRRRPQA